MTLVRDPALPCYVMGDSTRLRQVLTCLVSNAVKFTHKGGVRVEATLTPDAARDNVVTFSVVDSGIGIPDENLGALFHPFTQGDASTARQYGGTGLGLAIARSLVLLMGGEDLSVQSRPGEGTSFVFSLPFGHAPEKTEPLPRAATGTSTLRILVAEDNQINQKIILNLLARLGYKADLAADGAEAVEAVTRQHYDVILMDVQMPKVDGLRATREIRKYFAEGRQPRIFAVTAHATKDDHDKCTNAGMDGYLTKPVDKELLRRTLAEVEESLRVRTGESQTASGRALRASIFWSSIFLPCFWHALFGTRRPLPRAPRSSSIKL
jgi:CheY-like chemotaxis protein/anti-sigma regulatory factor (Ser/Thr protein kinase)